MRFTVAVKSAKTNRSVGLCSAIRVCLMVRVYIAVLPKSVHDGDANVSCQHVISHCDDRFVVVLIALTACNSCSE